MAVIWNNSTRSNNIMTTAGAFIVNVYVSGVKQYFGFFYLHSLTPHSVTLIRRVRTFCSDQGYVSVNSRVQLKMLSKTIILNLYFILCDVYIYTNNNILCKYRVKNFTFYPSLVSADGEIESIYVYLITNSGKLFVGECQITVRHCQTPL